MRIGVSAPTIHIYTCPIITATKNPPGFPDGLCRGRSVCPRRYEANTRSQYKSVFVGGECRRGSCRDASGLEQGGKVMRTILPSVFMDGIAGNRGLGLQSFESATWAEIFIGDAEVMRGLAFEALGLIGACLCQLHRVLMVPADQVGVAVDQLTQTALDYFSQLTFGGLMTDAAERSELDGFEDRQLACDEIGGGITKGLAKGGDLAKPAVDAVDLSGGSG